MFALIQQLFQRLACVGCSVAGKTMLFGPKIGGTPTLLPRAQYYGASGRGELAANAGPQGSDGPQVYDAPYYHQSYDPVNPAKVN